MTTPRRAPWLLLAVQWALAVGVYPTLPPRIPTHFDFGGTVTGTSPTTWFSWFGLPFFATLTVGLLAALAAHLPRNPSLFNFPDKDRFLRLPASHQPPVIDEMRRVLDLTASGVVLVMGLVQWMLWRAVFGPVPPVAHGLLVGFTLLLGPGILIQVSRVGRAVDVAEAQWRADTEPGKRSVRPRD